jgi:hypothetical protein
MSVKAWQVGAWIVLASACSSDGGTSTTGKTEQTDAPAMSVDDAGSSGGCMDEGEGPGDTCPGQVACGPKTCSVCCMKGFAEAVACDEAGVCPADFQANRCDGPEDCDGGEVCCASARNPTACVAASECPGPLCHEDSDCTAGQTCQRGNTFDWWGFCK